jgi:hypothetical protein
MTLPWAVDPDDRRSPSAQVKPAPSKVGAAPEAAAEVAEPAADDLEPAADVAVLAAEVAAAAADVVLAVLLSLPQALRVKAPTAKRATSPLIRVIFTLVPPSSVTTTDELTPCSGAVRRQATSNTFGR